MLRVFGGVPDAGTDAAWHDDAGLIDHPLIAVHARKTPILKEEGLPERRADSGTLQPLGLGESTPLASKRQTRSVITTV